MTYSREIKTPKTDKEGLQNSVQMIINYIEEGNTREAILRAVDLIDSLNGSKFYWIDPDRQPISEPDEPDEPAQITSIVPVNEINRKISDHRNSYYI